MVDYKNFEYLKIANEVNTKYNNSVNMLLPFTYLVTLGTVFAMPDFLAVKGSSKDPILAQIDGI